MTVTTNGLSDLKTMLTNQIASTYKYFAVGTGTTTPTDSDTDLENPIEVNYASGVYRKEVDNVYNDGLHVVWVCRLAQSEFNVPGTDLNLSEIGIFNAQSGGRMLMRVLFDEVLVKNDAKDYVVTVKLKLWSV